MEFTQTNLQAAGASINSNIEDINKLRENCGTADANEVAQLFLIDKFKLSQTEASEIVDELKAGIDSYTTLYAKMEENPEEVIKDKMSSATASMNKDEKVRYLASMLSALELASNPDLSQEAVDAKLSSNMQKGEDELANEIVNALGTLPIESLSQAADQLNPETIKGVAEAIEKNTDEFRFMAALQLYAAQRDGSFKVADADSQLSPSMIGALAAGSVDAMLATASLNEGKITLEKWQIIMKYICGALFAIATTALATFGLLLLALPIMGLIWNVLGTGFFATLLLFIVLIPLLSYGANKTTDVTVWMLDKLDPIYDKVIVKITSVVKNIYAKISTWIKAKYNRTVEAVAETVSQEKQPEQAREEEERYGNNAPAMA